MPNLPHSLNWIPTLDAGWYVNFGASNLGLTARSAAFVPVIRVRQEQINGTRTDTKPPLVRRYDVRPLLMDVS